MTRQELFDAITEVVKEILTTGNDAPEVYLRVRPSGTVDVTEETSWCCSPDEYYERVPHTLSLEVLKSTRDYSGLSEEDIEANADAAPEAAEELVSHWAAGIDSWIKAGNFTPSPGEDGGTHA